MSIVNSDLVLSIQFWVVASEHYLETILNPSVHTPSLLYFTFGTLIAEYKKNEMLLQKNIGPIIKKTKLHSNLSQRMKF